MTAYAHSLQKWESSGRFASKNRSVPLHLAASDALDVRNRRQHLSQTGDMLIRKLGHLRACLLEPAGELSSQRNRGDDLANHLAHRFQCGVELLQRDGQRMQESHHIAV